MRGISFDAAVRGFLLSRRLETMTLGQLPGSNPEKARPMQNRSLNKTIGCPTSREALQSSEISDSRNVESLAINYFGVMKDVRKSPKVARFEFLGILVLLPVCMLATGFVIVHDLRSWVYCYYGAVLVSGFSFALIMRKSSALTAGEELSRGLRCYCFISSYWLLIMGAIGISGFWATWPSHFQIENIGPISMIHANDPKEGELSIKNPLVLFLGIWIVFSSLTSFKSTTVRIFIVSITISVTSFWITERSIREILVGVGMVAASVGTTQFCMLKAIDQKRKNEKVSDLDAEAESKFILLLRGFGWDSQPLVLDLFIGLSRSFSAWSNNHEMELADALEGHSINGSFIRLIALGRPGERWAPLGARRIYCSSEIWMNRVQQLINDASFVIVVPGSTSSIMWECNKVFRDCDMNRVIIWCACAASEYRIWRESMIKEFSIDLPKSIPYFITFNAPNGSPAPYGRGRMMVEVPGGRAKVVAELTKIILKKIQQ